MKQINNFLFLVVILICYSQVYGQAGSLCPSLQAGVNQTLSCNQSCTTLDASFIDLRETTSYNVESIPHTPPILYNEPLGNTLSVNAGDVWSSAINLPFNFCFYGVNYNSILVGSNGNLNFNLANASGISSGQFSSNCPSPALVPAGNIFGVYHDISPSVCGNIAYYFVGAAPCRKFIVSYDLVCHFSCGNLTSRHMIVLNETSNNIEVYVASKPICSNWNSGNAIIGIQNPTGNTGIAAPGRNTSSSWNVTSPEAWRFKPAGLPQYSFNWSVNGAVIGTNDTLLVCPNVPTNYVANINYTLCNGTLLNYVDSVLISPSPNALNVIEIANNSSVCGQATGSLTVLGIGGSGNYTYSIDGINFSPINSFPNLAAGSHTIFVNDSSGCSGLINAVITDSLSFTANLAPTAPSCVGLANGEINTQVLGNTGPYSYSLNNGMAQNSSQFDSLSPGPYSVTITDQLGCFLTLSTFLAAPNMLFLIEDTTFTTTCYDSNGGLQVYAFGGAGGFSYALDSLAIPQNSGLFMNLSAGNYLVNVTDTLGCLAQLNVSIDAKPPIYLTFDSVFSVSCFGMLDGRIYIKRRFGEGPFSYTINGGAPQASNDFFNLIPGDYTIIGTDGDGCTYLIDTTVIEPGILYADEMPDIVACQGYETMLQGSGYGGTKPYSYYWSNGINGNGVFVVGDDDTTFYLTIVDLYGCTATNEVFIDVIPEPIALAIPDVIYGYANLFVAINNQSLYANHYTWDFGNNYITTINTAAYVNTTYTDTGTFTITLTATNGYCEDVWQGNITVIHLDSIEANIPNIFSPNGDGDNDTYFFEMKNVMSIEGAIYNRWGVKIADYNDLNYSWDGKVDGVDAVEGVYYVQFTMIGIDWDIRKDITYFHLVR